MQPKLFQYHAGYRNRWGDNGRETLTNKLTSGFSLKNSQKNKNHVAIKRLFNSPPTSHITFQSPCAKILDS